MKRRLLILAAVLLVGATVLAQQWTASTHEALTVDDTARSLASATILLGSGQQAQECSGQLETAAVRFRYDGGTPTASTGQPLAIGDVLTLRGAANIRQFKAIRTSSDSGVIRFTCAFAK